MRLSLLPALALLAWAGTAAAAPPPPAVTVTLAPIERLLADARATLALAARLAPNEQEARQVSGALDPFLEKTFGPDWAKAVDTARPLAAYAEVREDLPASPVVVLVPVRDEKLFLKVL